MNRGFGGYLEAPSFDGSKERGLGGFAQSPDTATLCATTFSLIDQDCAVKAALQLQVYEDDFRSSLEGIYRRALSARGLDSKRVGLDRSKRCVVK